MGAQRPLAIPSLPSGYRGSKQNFLFPCLDNYDRLLNFHPISKTSHWLKLFRSGHLMAVSGWKGSARDN